jgi:glycosyltransferase involved in cell wall biosynthesis
MKNNRVLVFSTDDHLYPAGGAEQAFGNIVERLPHIEFDLICAKLRKGSKAYEKVGNVHIYRMGFGIPRIDGFILALFGHYCAYSLMRKNTYDFVWSIMASYGAFSAVRVKRKTGLPFLLTLQEGDSFEYIYNRVKYVRKSFNEIFYTADGVQAISQYLLAWGKEMGYGGDHGVVIPNGVDVGFFARPCTEDEVRDMRIKFGFPESAYILMTSSRLEKKNGIRDVIDALALLPEEVCFVVCGSGSLESNLHEQVTRLGLGARVKFMGFVEPRELPQIMKASDAFIRASLTEGLGTAFLEAMAAGILTVGTNVGGIPDFLTDGKTGFFVDVENPESIKATVEKIMKLDLDAKSKIKNQAETMIRERYNWEHVARDMESLFNTLTHT